MAEIIKKDNGYSNHHILKKNRLVILLENPKCEWCGEPAQLVHHRDRSRSNHVLSNLMPVCCKCHTRLHPRQGTGNRMSFTKPKAMKVPLKELALKYDLSVATVSNRRRRGIPLSLPKNTFSKRYLYLWK